MTTTSRPGSITELLAEMRHETDLQTNGTLTESYKLLVTITAAGFTSDAAKLAKAVIADELAKRNAHLRNALDAWELDLNTTVTHDEVVLQHAAKMKPALRYHHGTPIRRAPEQQH
jgi:hypothetical protein